MSLPPWHEAPIDRSHRRDLFDCGDRALNEFLQRYARQSDAQGGAKTFIAVPAEEPTRVLGFYTLSPASIAFARTPAVLTRGLARHEVPVFRLGRLAVDRSVQGQGLGGQLLLAAGRRCLRAAQEVGGIALLIDAKDDSISEWYIRYGAIPLQDTPLSLVLPLATIRAALEAVGKL